MTGSEPDGRVPGYLGRILDGLDPVGTCFQVAPGVLVTAWHVIEDLGAASDGARVRVDPLTGGAAFDAVVKRVYPSRDLAILTADCSLPAVTGRLAASDGMPPRTQVTVTGHAVLEDQGSTYRFLTAVGQWGGGTTRDDAIPLGRIIADRVVPGMSGAPVIRDSDGAVAGVVSGRYNSSDGWPPSTAWVVRTEDLAVLLDGIADLPMVSQPLSGDWQPPPTPLMGSVSATSGGYVNLGVHIGDVYLGAGAPVRTRYHEQVQRIAPKELVGRGQELAELERFCTDPTTAGRYLWWRAAAWSGKSALLSWFVLHPPAGVRIVSFFVTARLANQNSRAAFIENMLEQLLTMLGQSLPPFLTDTTREAHLLGLLGEAAEACRTRGEQFVLVVDGLDEDRGAHSGSDWHSIAGLLPDSPRAGMRVIVASRADPPLPGDVPPDHPLRDTGIRRFLSVSPNAVDLRERMERDLVGLLQGDQLGRDLLGLVVAAGGGLSEADLAALTGCRPSQVREYLRTVAGRSFTRLPGHYRQASPIYLLAHEDLQVTAGDQLGAASLTDYRNQLHGWAQHYRDRLWPEDTPDYLLQGYPDMLTQVGDLPRLVECAIDRERQERLLLISSGDSTALTLIVKTIDLCAAEPTPDLNAIVRLARHRDRLRDRNSNIPSELPAAWVLLGQIDRAMATARSIAKPSERVRALRLVAEAVARAGDHDRAVAIAYSIAKPSEQVQVLRSVAVAVAVEAGDRDTARTLLREAETRARTITNLEEQTWALRSVVEALAQAGDYDRAEVIARSIPGSERRSMWLRSLAEAAAQAGDYNWAHALARSLTNSFDQSCVLQSVAKAMALAGVYDRAEAIARSIRDPRPQVQALRLVAEAMALAGELDGARTLLREAEAHARSLSSRFDTDQVEALRSVAEAMALAGDLDGARTLLREAEAHARSLTFDADQARALQLLAATAARAGDYDRAEALARSITDRFDQAKAFEEQARALWFVAEAIAKDGEYDRAEAICRSIIVRIDQANTSSRAITDPFDQAKAFELQAKASELQAQALQSVAEAAARAGYYDRAEALARSMTQSEQQLQALRSVVEALAQAGDYDRAEALARSMTQSEQQLQALRSVAEAMARSGELNRARILLRNAEALARSFIHPERQARTLRSVGMALAQAGDYERARTLLRYAEALVRSITEPGLQARLLALVSEAAAEARDFGRAEALARSITDPHWQERLLAFVVEAAARARDFGGAEALARSFPDSYSQSWQLSSVVEAMGQAGDHGRAEALARSITNPGIQAKALASVVEAMGQAGDHGRAEALAHSITKRHFRMQAFLSVGVAVARAGDRDRARGLLREAEALARNFPDSERLQVAYSQAEFDQNQLLREMVDAIANSSTRYQHQPQELSSVGVALARAGDRDRARRLLREAEALARSAPPEHLNLSQSQAELDQTLSLRAVAEAMAQIGDYDQAEVIARTLPHSGLEAELLQSVAKTAAQAGDYNQARTLLYRLEARARSLTRDYEQASAFQSVVETMAQIGDYDRAEALARSLTDPKRQALALHAVIDHAGPDRRLRLLTHQVQKEEWYKSSRYLASEAADAFDEGVSELADLSSGLLADE